jgi:hypothetical protein
MRFKDKEAFNNFVRENLTGIQSELGDMASKLDRGDLEASFLPNLALMGRLANKIKDAAVNATAQRLFDGSVQDFATSLCTFVDEFYRKVIRIIAQAKEGGQLNHIKTHAVEDMNSNITSLKTAAQGLGVRFD